MCYSGLGHTLVSRILIPNKFFTILQFCNLRSNNQLHVLLASCQPRTKLKTYGERSFQYAAPTEWNNLPLIIRESPSLAIFKNKLKTFLFHST